MPLQVGGGTSITAGMTDDTRVDNLVETALRNLLELFDRQDPDHNVAGLEELLPDFEREDDEDETLADVRDRAQTDGGAHNQWLLGPHERGSRVRTQPRF